MAKQFEYYCNYVSRQWHNELNIEVFYCLSQAGYSTPDLEKCWISQE